MFVEKFLHEGLYLQALVSALVSVFDHIFNLFLYKMSLTAEVNVLVCADIGMTWLVKE